MVQIVTFLDTTLPKEQYAMAATTLRDNGWMAVRSTGAVRDSIRMKYYIYLIQQYAAQVGKNASMVTPDELEPLYARAQSEYDKYEMYVKDAPNVEHILEAPAEEVPEEVFATDAEVEAMQPGYAEMEELMSMLTGFRMGGKKKRTHKKRTHKKKTQKKRTHKKRLHTRRRY